MEDFYGSGLFSESKLEKIYRKSRNFFLHFLNEFLIMKRKKYQNEPKFFVKKSLEGPKSSSIILIESKSMDMEMKIIKLLILK